jgi:hypothetical protein
LQDVQILVRVIVKMVVLVVAKEVVEIAVDGELVMLLVIVAARKQDLGIVEAALVELIVPMHVLVVMVLAQAAVQALLLVLQLLDVVLAGHLVKIIVLQIAREIVKLDVQEPVKTPALENALELASLNVVMDV